MKKTRFLARFDLSLEQVTRIELARTAWKAVVLPLNYTCIEMVGKTGFEPATSWSQTKRSAKLSYFPTIVYLSLHAYILYNIRL